ncbi:hypothetical protein H5410_057602 [Solanum commersonii]|uniref:Pentatricopeptide repeat-containing protein n=1 Tax=Solanum commersonii TaxID=4109 RepID=A0A9J5WQN1_SOLCO|nr:hypothetical protein H5410_057602 [Solanum commersonii]
MAQEVIYTTLLKVYVKGGLFEKSKELLKESEALGYAKDEIWCMFLNRRGIQWVLGSARQLKSALQLARTEDKEEIAVDIETIPLCMLWTVCLERNCRCL